MGLLNEDEQRVMDQTSEVYNAIVGWGLQANGEELAAAIHAVQGFIVHRAVQRLEPEVWSPWFSDTGG